MPSVNQFLIKRKSWFLEFKDMVELIERLGPERATLTFYETLQTDFDAEVARLKQEVAREKAEAKIGASYRKALASAALSHHLAMQKMKQQCNSLLQEKMQAAAAVAGGTSGGRGLTVDVSSKANRSKKNVIRRKVRKKGL